MSEYIASAKVKIEPDTTGFQKTLREKLKPILSKPIPVAVTPVTTGFSKALREKLANLKAVSVPVIPAKLDAFRSAIAAQSVPIEVPVVVNPEALRAQLVAAVAAAEAGVVATVPVAFAGGAAAEVTALNAALTSLTSQMEKLAAAQTAATKGGSNLGKATKTLANEEQLREKAVKALAASNTALVGAQNEQLDLSVQSSRAATAATKANVAYAASTDLVAAADTAQNQLLLEQASRQQELAAAEKTRITNLEKSQAASLKTADLEKDFNKIRAEANDAMKIEARAYRDLTAIKEQQKVVSRSLAATKSLETAASKANATGLAQEAARSKSAMTAYINDLKDREKAIKSEMKAAEAAQAKRIAEGKTATGQLKFARRGAAATALSLLGIRGATLASTGAFLAGAAAATLFALSVKSAADLQQELNVFRETAGATASELEQVRATAEELGRDIRLPGISAAEAAQAMTGLARAGLSVEDSITGASGVLQLAIAANLDLARSTEIVASALNAFGLSGRDAISVADTLANAANLAQGSIDDMGIAMQQASAVGRQAGLSFEDTATFLTILAKAGLRGSDAGTSLRTGLIRLINPTEKAAETLAKLGVNIRDAQGNIRPDVFQNLAVATADMTKEQRDQTIAQLAGNDAVRAFSIAMRVSLPDLLKYRASLREAGSAARLTAARAEGLSGSARGLASNLQTVGISIGRSATPALQSIVDSMNAAVLAMSESDSVARALSDSMTILGNAVRTTGSIISALAPTVGWLTSELFAMTQAIGFGPLLAGLAAFKLFKPTVGALAASFGFLKTQVLLATTSFSIARETTTRLGASAISLSEVLKSGAKSFNLWVLAATAAAVGLTYLISRQSATEKATKSLTKANDALAESMNRTKSAAQGLAGAERGTEMARRAVDTAKAAAAQAELELKMAASGKGTERYRQLLNNLKTAQQDVAFAQEDLGRAISAEAEAREENEAAANAEDAARRESARTLRGYVDLVNEQVQAAKEGQGSTLIPTPGELSALEQEARGREEIVKKLREQAEAGKDSADAAERDISRRLSALATAIESTGVVPDTQEMEVLITTPNLREALSKIAVSFGVEGKRDVKAWVDGFMASMPGQRPRLAAALTSGFTDAGERAGRDTGRGFGLTMNEALAAAKAGIVNTFLGILGALKTEAEAFAEQEDLLTIAMGGRVTPQARLDQLRKQEETLRKTLQTIAAMPGPLTDEQKALRTATRDQLAAVLVEIAGIEDQMVEDAKQAKEDSKAKAEKIASDLAEAGQAFIDQLTLKQQPFLRKQERASLTESLADDIRINKTLQRLYKLQINKIRENVKDKETRNAAIRELQQRSFQLDIELNKLLAQQAEQQQQLVRERFELDIQFFQTTENRRGEINARRRFIAYLKRLQKEEKEGTIEYKRLRNEIAEQEKALKDLKEQDKKRKNAWAELTWQFMQTQQGFAANLLGNLIPLGASHNLVGNISTTGGGGGILGGGQGQVNIPGVAGSAAAGFGGGLGEALINQPDRRLLQAQARATGGTQPPMGRDQASVEIQILQTIASILARMERGSRHPEARKSQISQNAAYETMPHGAQADP